MLVIPADSEFEASLGYITKFQASQRYGKIGGFRGAQLVRKHSGPVSFPLIPSQYRIFYLYYRHSYFSFTFLAW